MGKWAFYALANTAKKRELQDRNCIEKENIIVLSEIPK